ncbi:OadG family protein [Desulfotalea psychrophila]|uniref:Uncharacterized protein n=1 Tax=Desulfotalea psychrophila (strain LSv54 / DSM 12343) TaxID=177439 RepID=Q6AQF9_DESPS|nr:OadG family protein [Desulfotalea psychrophila]CAG35414.1 unknown protein [Desulfotalea psychrophila LSv54]
MIFAGLKLMLVGMTTVLLFLIAMILLIQLISYCTRGFARKELDEIEATRRRQAEARKKKAAAKRTAVENVDEDIAVISAAVAAFEAERYA